ncbi:MAG: GH1 family beta-glucosidase [Bacteroidota bacterium]|nr:GH1 family beta-glucosidase [Bacteroidota bacterium]
MIPNTEFYWGVATSAAQTEGASFEDGKGPSIWDDFVARKKTDHKVKLLLTGTEFYYRYQDDIAILSELKIPNFRFSLSWPRILPNGTGAINMKGLDFYDRVVDSCLEKNITPWITLYHWDLPLALEQRGGWTNREIINWFDDYVTLCTKRLGDRVKNWMVLNEPMAFCGAGYFLGVHAPGRKGRANFVAAAHHAVLATSSGVDRIHSQVNNAFVGSTYSLSHVSPYRMTVPDVKAAKRVDDLLNNFFLFPALGKGYPLSELKFLSGIEKYMLPGDEQRMKARLDFIGVQNYTREIIKFAPFAPFIKAATVSPKKRNVPFTEMGWEVYPEAIYQVLKKLSAIEGMPQLIVTENGAAFADVFTADGSINDTARVNYLETNIQQVLKAKQEGINVGGYFAWSLTDNFEWAEGYRPRFGLVNIDYENHLKRTVKASGKWYKQFIENRL